MYGVSVSHLDKNGEATFLKECWTKTCTTVGSAKAAKLDCPLARTRGISRNVVSSAALCMRNRT